MQSADTVLGVLRERDRRHGVITGEPDARKRASPVRREAARKRTRPAGPSPCGPPSSDRIGISPGGYRYALRVAREIRYGHTRFQDIAMSTGAPRRAHRTAAQTRTSRRDRAPAIFAASATPRVPPD